MDKGDYEAVHVEREREDRNVTERVRKELILVTNRSLW